MNHHLAADEKQIWSLIRNKIEEQVTSQQFSTWFANLKLIKFEADKIYIHVPNSFCREWIENNYMDVLSTALSEVTKTNHKVKLVVDGKSTRELKPALPRDLHSLNVDNKNYINTNYSFDNFFKLRVVSLSESRHIFVCLFHNFFNFGLLRFRQVELMSHSSH